ncbi:MAG: DUF559 domain-containing protein [Gammaproteobacteria bacterium]|nr:DUF559 domain-containing protein [Gemmatimonadota bacterium]NIU73029.1 DUF559 domain-containing protein [Gammaproteobacteria bacterium]
MRGSERRRPGVRVHRVRALPPDEVTRIDGIPVTNPVRTLLDLAGAVDRRDLERALARADRQGLAGRKKILALLARHPRRPGAGALRACLRADISPALTRSRAEEEFLDLAGRAQFRAPEANVVIEGHEVDFLWRAERLVVEVDGFAYHGSRRTFERDRRRDAVLAARGYHVMRVTWRQLGTEPEAVVARLAQALARAGRA